MPGNPLQPINHGAESRPQGKAVPPAHLALLAYSDSLRAMLMDGLQASHIGQVHAYSTPNELDAAQDHFDALIIDLDLPATDALAVCSAQRLRDPRLTIVAMSARSGIAQRVAALNAGADQFLEKPVSHPELIAGIQRGLSRGRHF